MEYNGLLFSHRKNEILAFATTQMDLEGITVNEISQIDQDYMISLIYGI